MAIRGATCSPTAACRSSGRSTQAHRQVAEIRRVVGGTEAAATSSMLRPIWRYAIAMFAMMVAHVLLETARDVALLVKLGPDTLALAYLAIAGLAVGAM